jgi:hypothetical protein
MTLKELQRMMSPGSGTVIHLQQCLRGRHPRLFQGRGKQLVRKNDDNDFLHCTSIDSVGCTTKRKQIESSIFRRLRVSGFTNGKPEFSSSNAACNFLEAHGSFHVSQWIKSRVKFDKHHIARLPHPLYSPDLSLCDFWLFGMLKGILKDRELHSYDEIEKAITMAWNDLTFDEV